MDGLLEQQALTLTSNTQMPSGLLRFKLGMIVGYPVGRVFDLLALNLLLIR